MKLRVGACALMLVLAGCSGESPESGMAGMRGVAASKPTGALPTSLPLARAIGASIANLPDRGALLSFPDKAKSTRQEGAYTWFPTAISEAHAFKGIATGEMTVPSPDGSQVKLRYERHVEEIDGNWTWIGRVVGGDPMQEAIITFGEKAVFGSIPQANGKPALSLQTRNGTVFAVQTDPTKVVSATKGHVDVMIPEARALRSSMGAAASLAMPTTQNTTAIAQGAVQTAANTVDVAIGYTPEFATANGGASAATSRLVFLVQVGNQAFTNSGVNGYLRIVNLVQVNYTNTNTNQTALQELTGNTGSSSVVVPASLAPLRNAREQYGADIAVLVRKFNTPENEGCGIAWLNGANQTAITAADASWGYAVISDGFDQGTDGKTYYCADETLVHEAAHLMGSAHDRANSLNSSNGLLYGRYPYSFGYKTAANAGNFYTVMAYGDTGQIAHRIFSTPLRSTCGSGGNLACGIVDSEDNARSLNQTLPLVAAFRQSVVADPTFVLAGGDFNGDGRADLVRIDDGTQTRVWLKSYGASFTQKIPAVYPAGWSLVGTADIDGDRKSDLVWYNATTGALHYWLMNESGVVRFVNGGTVPSGFSPIAVKDLSGDGRADIVLTDNSSQVRLWTKNASGDAFTEGVIGAFPGGWRFAGAADVDVDGRADLFWRNQQTGELHYWLMNGSTIRSFNAGGTLDGAYSVLAVTDLNGDGRADIVWSNGSELRAWLKNASGTAFTSLSFAGQPGGWTLVGAGDVDGDGKSDLFWYEQSSGTIDYWLMDGGAVRGFRRSQLTAGKYAPVAVADISNDNRADIYWANGLSDVRMWIKDAAGTSYSTDVSLNLYPGGWTPAGAGDVDLDRKADLWWFQPTTRELHYWLMNEAGIRSYNAAGTLPAGFTPRSISDFNGDGRSDVLISDGNMLRIWTKNAGAGFTEASAGNYPAGWVLVGAGDVDGDGKVDLFWYNSTGALHYWLMDGPVVRSFVNGGTMTAGYTPRAVGDFNGDGRADVVWANGADVRMWIKTAAGAGFTSATFSSYPTGWNVFGARDANADGRSDLFWYHEASGTMDYWLMNGASITGYYRAGVLP